MNERWVFVATAIKTENLLPQVGEEVRLACRVGDTEDATVMLARLEWWPEKDGTSTLKWQDTMLGGIIGVADGPWSKLSPYAFQRLDEPPTPADAPEQEI